jgi:hypothetical protein
MKNKPLILLKSTLNAIEDDKMPISSKKYIKFKKI